MSKTKNLDAKINSEPINVPTPLPNQVEVLANINNKVMKTIEWEDIVTNIQNIMERCRNPTKRNKVTINQSQRVSKKETTSTPPVQGRREYQRLPHKRKVIKRRGTSGCYDSGATANAMKPGDEYIPTKIPSDKVFECPQGEHIYGSTKARLHHPVREPARSADVVPGLVRNSLLSASKFADAKYVSVLTPEEVLIFDDLGDLQLTISQEAVLKGWRCKTTGLWRVPLTPGPMDEK